MLPQIATPPSLGFNASVIGKVTMGARAILRDFAAVRGDGHFVRIGDDFFLGSYSTIHIAHGLYPTIVGNNVTVGANAVVHACDVADNCVFGNNVVVLDGAVISDGVIIADNSTVFPRAKLASGYVYAGTPAKQIRPLAPGELDEQAKRIRQSCADVGAQYPDTMAPVFAPNVFVAHTAYVDGNVDIAAAASVFFSCRLHAGGNAISIGENTNVQDNSLITCTKGDTYIGKDVTLGHNVTMDSSRVGDRALVGIGSTLRAGSVMEAGSFLAAGAITEEGQVLEGGWIWAGRPAKPLSKLTDDKRAMMKVIVDQYCLYARDYTIIQDKS